MSSQCLKVLLLIPLLSLKVASPELIFRGQCTSYVQPQEVAITVDTSDLAFNLYVIHMHRAKLVKSADECISNCLSTVKPVTCKSAIFDFNQKTCWLLRASKETALEFDTRNGTSLMSGILIAPQLIIDGVIDRRNGVPNCDNFCPAPISQSSEAIVPVCIQDCPNNQAYCAGELGNCMDGAVKKVTVHQPNVHWWLGSFAGINLMTTSFTKRYDYSSMRLTIQFGSWIFRPGDLQFPLAEGYIYPLINGLYCQGESGMWFSMHREIAEGGNSRNQAEPVHAEFSCTAFEQVSGNLQVVLWYDYRHWGRYAGHASGPGINLNGVRAPIMVMVEEYLPARTGNFKLDDSAHCESATVFNSVSQQWTSHNHGNINGRTDFVMWKYKKRSDASALRIYWGGSIHMNAFRKCIHLYFTINDQVCSNPFSIETSFREFNYGDMGALRPGPDSITASLDGICRGLPAGRYDIALWVNFACPFFNDDNNYHNFQIGNSRPSQMIVEEINEAQPINSLLMADGSLTTLPYYNRQYFPFTEGCEGWAGNPCFDPITTKTYNKLQTASDLHIKWYGTQQYCTGDGGRYSEAVRWYVKINGQECSNPLKIESWWYNEQLGYGICRLRAKYVEGVCRMPIPAGPITITLHIGKAVSDWGGYSRLYAATMGGTSYLMVEEMYADYA